MRNGTKPLEITRKTNPKNAKVIPKGAQTASRQPEQGGAALYSKLYIVREQQQYNNICIRPPLIPIGVDHTFLWASGVAVQ